MGQNSLAYSLIFKVVDGASAKIREIANLMAEPTAAVEALGDASEASSVRQVSAFQKAKDAVSDISDAISKPISRMAEMGRAAGEAAEKFSHSFAGIGAIAAEGFSLKEVANDQDFWLNFRVNAGMAKNSIEELREAIDKTGDHYGVARDKMVAALQAFRDMGGNPEAFGAQAQNVGIAVKATGMDAGAAGAQLASLSRLGITDPQQVLSTIAQMNAQLGNAPEKMNAAAEASGRLVATMQKLHMAGAQGALALNAVYAVAAKSTGNARLARSSTDAWLEQLATRGYQNQLAQGLGERVTDKNGAIMDPRIIMQKMAAKYAWAQKLPENQREVMQQHLDGMFGEDAAKMFRSVGGEIATTGRSTTMDQVLGAKGDSAELMKRADEASQSLASSMVRLQTAMKNASETVFVGPINAFAEALDHCNGLVADVVITLGLFVALGTSVGWIISAARNFRILAAAVGIYNVATVEATAAAEVQAAVSTGSWIAGLVTGIGEIAVATWAWTAAMLANPITWIVVAIIAGIALLVAVIGQIYHNWDWVWSKIGGPVKTAWAFIMAICKGYVALLLGEWHLISAGFEWVSKKLGIISGVWTGIKTFAGGVFDWLADKFKWLFAGLGYAADGFSKLTGGAVGPSKDSGAGGGGGGGGDSGAGAGGEGGGGGGSSGPLTTGKGAPSVGQMMAYFQQKGWSTTAAAGIAASLYQESKFKSGAVGDNGAAYGLAQWHDDRQREFARHFGHSMIGSSWQEQAAFVDYELHNREGRAGRALKGNISAGAAGALMTRLYERPADVAGQSMKRAQIAVRMAGGENMPTGGSSGPALAANDSNHLGPASGHSAVVPFSIYGPAVASNDAAPSFGDSSSGGGDTTARAHLTVTVDAKGHVKTHLDHSGNMEAHLDRGPGMTMAWG